jgi:uncharacterized RDD family membrane protein YckC
MNYAGLWMRGFAQVLDYVVFCIVFFPVTYLVKGTWLMTPEDHLWIIFDPICGIFLIVIFCNFIFLEGWTGTTVGKVILGLRVKTIENNKITLKQSMIRNLGRLIDGLHFFHLIAIISISKSPARQRVGDKLAGTVVVNKR